MPTLLDLFCCQGGAGTGYHRAGYEVVGVDMTAQPRYPFTFVQADALAYLKEHGHEFDVIHASPPCQAYSATKSLHNNEHPDLLVPTRDALIASGRPWIMENVPGAPMIRPVMLCGSMFRLGAYCRDRQWRQLRRHRLFESSVPLRAPRRCAHIKEAVGVYGHGGSGTGGTEEKPYKGYQATAAEASTALGINWMTYYGMAQAIPPTYTEHLGRQILAGLDAG